MRWCLFRGCFVVLFYFFGGGVGPSDIIFWGWRKRSVGGILVARGCRSMLEERYREFQGYWDGIMAVPLALTPELEPKKRDD